MKLEFQSLVLEFYKLEFHEELESYKLEFHGIENFLFYLFNFFKGHNCCSSLQMSFLELFKGKSCVYVFVIFFLTTWPSFMWGRCEHWDFILFYLFLFFLFNFNWLSSCVTQTPMPILKPILLALNYNKYMFINGPPHGSSFCRIQS